MMLLISLKAQTANENNTSLPWVLLLGAEFIRKTNTQRLKSRKRRPSIHYCFRGACCQSRLVHQQEFLLRRRQNQVSELNKHNHTVQTNGLQRLATSEPDRVQHLMGNDIFCCEQALGSFGETEVEQRMTEATAVCNSPCRGERKMAATLWLFLFLLDGTFGQRRRNAEQVWERTDKRIFLKNSHIKCSFFLNSFWFQQVPWKYFDVSTKCIEIITGLETMSSSERFYGARGMWGGICFHKENLIVFYPDTHQTFTWITQKNAAFGIVRCYVTAPPGSLLTGYPTFIPQIAINYFCPISQAELRHYYGH